MKAEFKESFKKDLRKIKSRDLLNRVKLVIEEVELVKNVAEVNNLKKLRGRGNYYRIRVGHYRVGIKLDRGKSLFIRFLHRKEIYRYFP